MKRASISKVALYWHSLVMIVFSMIACQMINHHEPGFQWQQNCSDDRVDERAERAPSLQPLSVFLCVSWCQSVNLGLCFFHLCLCLDCVALTQRSLPELSSFITGFSSKYCTYWNCDYFYLPF